MIEMHTHMLPGMDNGSKDYKDSEKMIDDAISQGVDKIVLTPHQGDYGTVDRNGIINRYKTFKKWFEKKDVSFFLGSEVNYSPYVLEKIKNNQILTMNGTNIILLDFLDCQNEDIVQVVSDYKKDGFRVIVAHVEYYTNLTISDIERIKEKGALIQVDAETIIDKKYEKWLKKMLKERLIDFVSSNVHTSNVENCMKEAYEQFKKKTDEDYADEVFKRNQKNLLLL